MSDKFDHEKFIELWKIAQDLSSFEEEVVIKDDDVGVVYCVFCDGSPDVIRTSFHHEPDCLIMRAKNALHGEKDA